MAHLVCQNRKIKNFEKYLIEFKDSEAVLLVSENCPWAGHDCSGCKGCYGKVCQVFYQEFDSVEKKFVNKSLTFRDSYVLKKNEIKKMFEATDFFNNCIKLKKIEQVKTKKSGESINFRLSYGERPLTWLTDCSECKMKYGDKTPCKDIDGNALKGLLPNFCGEQKQRILYI